MKKIALAAFLALLWLPLAAAQTTAPIGPGSGGGPGGGGGGGGTPCTTTALSIQYNAAGVFGCVSGWTTNGTTALTGGPTSLFTGGTGLFNLNTATAPTPITGTALQVVGADAAIGRVQINSFGAIAALSVTRANGTGASPTAVLSGDQIGGLNAYSFVTSAAPAYVGPVASYQTFATQNHTSSANGSKAVIATTPNGSTTLTTGLTVDQDQSVAMAGRATIATSLAINGATIGTNALAVNGVTLFKPTTTAGLTVAGDASGTYIINSSGSGRMDIGNTDNSNVNIRINNSNVYSFTGTLFTAPLDISLASNSSRFLLGSSSDVILAHDAANTLAQRNGVNAQTLRVYGSFTDSSNGDWFSIAKAAGGNATLGTVANGTGTAANLIIQTGATSGIVSLGNGGVEKIYISSLGITFPTDNTYDIGVSGSTRPRNVYAGTSFVVAGGIAALDTNGVNIGASNILYWNTRSQIRSSADGLFTILNAAANDFGRLMFGGTTSSFPALKRSTTILQARLADDSAYAPVETQTVRTACVAIGSLPAAGSAGRRTCVTDQITACPVPGTAPTAGGALVCPVFDNGTIWVGG